MALPSAIWAIRGAVVHGHGRGGSQLGFPTANVGLDEATIQMLLPLQNWVYFGWGCVEPPRTASQAVGVAVGGEVSGEAERRGQVFPLVMSVGFNPHFKDKALTVEAYFLHKFSSDFYGETVRIISCGPIREQAAFTTIEALIEIIRNDCAFAEDALLSQTKAVPELVRLRAHPFLANVGSPVDAYAKVAPHFIPNLVSGGTDSNL